jgi:Sec-independent protein translocase protein TatA
MDTTTIIFVVIAFAVINGKSLYARAFQIIACYTCYTYSVNMATQGKYTQALQYTLIMVLLFLPTILPFIINVVAATIKMTKEEVKSEKECKDEQERIYIGQQNKKATPEQQERIKALLKELSKYKDGEG